MMMGVFQIHGMEPGPLVFITSLDLIWVTFAAMFYANLCILGLGWLQTKTVVHLLRIPFNYLAPGILIMATVGAYAVRNLVVDVIIMFVAGIIAFMLRRTGYSVAGIVLGLILGDIGEQNFAQAMQMTHYDPITFFSRPIVAILFVAGSATLLVNIWKALRGQAEVVGGR